MLGVIAEPLYESLRLGLFYFVQASVQLMACALLRQFSWRSPEGFHAGKAGSQSVTPLLGDFHQDSGAHTPVR
jgi:hypothetical protein